MKRTSLLLFAGLSGLLAFAADLVAAPSDPIRVQIGVDRSVLPANCTDKAIIKIGLDGLKLPRRDARPPVNLALVIDRSGSMSGAKIEKAREAALEAVRRLAADDIVSVVAYDTRAEVIVPAQRVGNGRTLEAAIERIEPAGSTALYAGVTAGAAEVRRNIEGRYVNRIILLSDGLANVGPQSPEELGRLGAALMKEGISVSTIGLGLGFNEDLMTRLAQRSDGNTYFVENSSDLPGIFSAELGDVLSVVARRVVIEIEFPAGVRPLHFIGRDGTVRDRKAQLTLNQVYGGQEKFALIEVEVAGAAEGTTQEIARAKVSYEDAVSGRNAVAEVQKTVRFSASSEAVVASADHKVQADYAANVLAVAKDEAVVLVDARRNSDAGNLMRRRAAELDAMARTYRNAEVARMAAPAGAAAEKLEREGLGAGERKLYKAESSQIRNQQSAGSSSR